LARSHGASATSPGELSFEQERSNSPLCRRSAHDRLLKQALGRRQLDDDCGVLALALAVRTLATGRRVQNRWLGLFGSNLTPHSSHARIGVDGTAFALPVGVLRRPR
jgi:hypothetical protein